MDDERGWFETSDCSFWLKQFSWVFVNVYGDRYVGVDGDGYSSINTAQVKQDMQLRIISIALLISIFLAQAALTKWQKQQIGYSHLINFMLTITPLLPIVALNNWLRVEPSSKDDDFVRFNTEVNKATSD